MSEDSVKVRQYAHEVLAQSGSKEIYQGEVVAIDAASGTTAWVQSGDRTFLAFAKSEGRQVLFVGQAVDFRIDGMRAVDVQVSMPKGEEN
jgi:hypothetical protein